MKIEGSLQGQALPGLWKFGEWVTGLGKVYRVSTVDPLKHTLKLEEGSIEPKHSIGNVLLKLICRITLLPLLIGWIAKASYRSRYELEGKVTAEPVAPIPPQITPSQERENSKPANPPEAPVLTSSTAENKNLMTTVPKPFVAKTTYRKAPVAKQPDPVPPTPPAKQRDVSQGYRLPEDPHGLLNSQGSYRQVQPNRGPQKTFSTPMEGGWTSALDPERFCYNPHTRGKPFLLEEALTNEMERALNQLPGLPENTRFIIYDDSETFGRSPFNNMKEIKEIIEENRCNGKNSALLFITPRTHLSNQVYINGGYTLDHPLVPWRVHIKVKKDSTGMGRPDEFLGLEEIIGEYYPTFIDEGGGTSEPQRR